jgi:UDP-N-acetylglucosamine transferase subunit ALG13
MRTYGFRRAVEAILRTLPDVVTPDARVLWQVGVTDVSDLQIEALNAVLAASLKTAIAAADLVIAHAGVGSTLTALDQGFAPVLLTRRKIYDEMVDDHQLMLAGELHRRGLAVTRDPDELTPHDLLRAMTMCGEGPLADGVSAGRVRLHSTEPEAANTFFQVVSFRYERASLIVTSNKPFGCWGEVFGDEVVVAAMIDGARPPRRGRLPPRRHLPARDRDLGRTTSAANDDQ